MNVLVVRLPRLVAVLILPLVISCGPDTKGVYALSEGIFQVVEHRINESGCSEPGVPYTGPTPISYVVIFADRIINDPVYRVMNCGDHDDCILLRDAVLSTESGPVPSLNLTFFDIHQGGAQLTQSSTGFATGTGLCEDPIKLAAQLSLHTEDEISIRIEETVGPDYPSDAAGFCSIEAGKAVLRDVPCTEATFIAATRVD